MATNLRRGISRCVQSELAYPQTQGGFDAIEASLDEMLEARRFVAAKLDGTEDPKWSPPVLLVRENHGPAYKNARGGQPLRIVDAQCIGLDNWWMDAGWYPCDPWPKVVDWDLWLGPTAWRPYNSGYIGGLGGWSYIPDLGGGGITDWGTHQADLSQLHRWHPVAQAARLQCGRMDPVALPTLSVPQRWARQYGDRRPSGRARRVLSRSLPPRPLRIPPWLPGVGRRLRRWLSGSLQRLTSLAR